MPHKIVALVPMKHVSTRVPQKNFRMLGDKPLFHHILATLYQCHSVDRVVVDTDSEVIKDGVLEHFPDTMVIDRPVHLRGGDVPMNDVIAHDISQIESEYYLQTHSTNPLLKSQTIDRAVELFLDSMPIYDSLFGVTSLQTRLWNQLALPVNHNPNILLPTQNLPPLFEENSNMYVFNKTTIFERRNRIGIRPLMFEIERLEAWDIDEEIDFMVAEYLYNKSK